MTARLGRLVLSGSSVRSAIVRPRRWQAPRDLGLRQRRRSLLGGLRLPIHGRRRRPARRLRPPFHSDVAGSGFGPGQGGRSAGSGFGGQPQRGGSSNTYPNKSRRFALLDLGSSSFPAGDGILPPPPPLLANYPPATAPPSTLTCFACHRPGHFQSRCKFPPFCLICRSEGHLTVDCQNRCKPPVFK